MMSDDQVLHELRGAKPEDPKDPRERLRLYIEYQIECEKKFNTNADGSRMYLDDYESFYLVRLLNKLKIITDKNCQSILN